MQIKTRTSVWLIIMMVAMLGAIAGWIAHGALRPTHTVITTATIEQLRAHPSSFAGKKVTLAGRLTECFSWECSLCPETMTQKGREAGKCLALEFQPLVPGTGFGVEQQEEVLRFSSVVLTADFDPTCWRGSCTDRQTVLRNAHVVSVTKRRANRDGLWLGDSSQLHELSGAIAEKMKLAALRAGFPDNPPIKAFATDGHLPRFVVCWSSPFGNADDPGTWPRSFEGALHARSTLDFYRCNEVREVSGQLILQAA